MSGGGGLETPAPAGSDRWSGRDGVRISLSRRSVNEPAGRVSSCCPPLKEHGWWLVVCCLAWMEIVTYAIQSATVYLSHTGMRYKKVLERICCRFMSKTRLFASVLRDWKETILHIYLRAPGWWATVVVPGAGSGWSARPPLSQPVKSWLERQGGGILPANIIAPYHTVGFISKKVSMMERFDLS